MPLPLVPIGIAAGIAWIARKKLMGGSKMTPERKKLFEEAMKSLQEPVKLRALAAEFDKAGLKDEAKQLRDRANLRELPPEHKAQRRQVFNQLLKSDDPEKIEEGAARTRETDTKTDISENAPSESGQMLQ